MTMYFRGSLVGSGTDYAIGYRVLWLGTTLEKRDWSPGEWISPVFW